MQTLLILCQRRDLEHVLDALEDWKDEGKVLLYGYTSKESDGFILMHWTQLLPIAFQEKQLKADPGIIDYVVYDVLSQPTTSTTI